MPVQANSLVLVRALIIEASKAYQDIKLITNIRKLLVGTGSARPTTSTYVFVGAFRAGKPCPYKQLGKCGHSLNLFRFLRFLFILVMKRH